MEKEIWKDIIGYNGYYQVSNLGRVKSLDRIVNGKYGNKTTRYGMIRKPILFKCGYLYVTLVIDSIVKSVRVHRLVAQAFIDNPNNKSEVNHIDGNKQNNNALNLEWCTRSENAKHAFLLGLNKPSALGKFGSDHNTSKPIVQLTMDNEFIFIYAGQREAYRTTGIHYNQICQVINGRRKSTHGFKWMFKTDYDKLQLTT